MSTSITGYTGLNIDGLVSLQTGELSAIDLSGGDVTLTVAQCVNGVLSIAVGHATNAIIIPAAQALLYVGKLFIVVNGDAALAGLIKVAGGTAVTVAATKTAIVRINAAGTDVKRVTADV
jgi:hypothetical protein